MTKLDITYRKSVKETIELEIEKYGAIDVLANNAGYGDNSAFEQFSEERDMKIRESAETDLEKIKPFYVIMSFPPCFMSFETILICLAKY